MKYLDVEVLNKKLQEKNSYRLDLNGFYQEKNILPVLNAIRLLETVFSLKDERIKKALSNVKKLTGLHGRWEVIKENPTVALDVAHNEDGIRQLIHQINQTTFQQLHIIFGMVKDKDIEKVLVQFPKDAVYYFTKAQNPRALPENDLKEKAIQHGLNGNAYADVNLALINALSHATDKDLIVVCGSVFVIAEVDNDFNVS